MRSALFISVVIVNGEEEELLVVRLQRFQQNPRVLQPAINHFEQLCDLRGHKQKIAREIPVAVRLEVLEVKSYDLVA